jgi:predicted dehydrogenase
MIKFGVIGLNHGHIYWMIKGLLSTGKAECIGYFADEPELQKEMKRAFPSIPLVKNEEEIFNRSDVQLICSASRNDLRSNIAIRAMKAGKDVFVAKPGATTLEQLNEIEKTQKETGRSWFVWFCERLADPTSQKAIEIIESGKIGKLVNFIGLEPHKLNRSQRPSWMFISDQYGGILNDLGIHPLEMFCQLAKGKVTIDFSRVGNFANRDIQDFGEVLLKSESGTTCYIRTDWVSPETVPTYGDIRQIIIGTEGMIELRKTVDLAVDNARFTGHQLLLATHLEEPQRIQCEKKVDVIFENIIADIESRTNSTIPHTISLMSTRLALQAQLNAQTIRDSSL